MYEDQFSFSLGVVDHLRRALDSETYERDPIAGDSSDEKRIKRAKKRPSLFWKKKLELKKLGSCLGSGISEQWRFKNIFKWILILKCVSTRDQIFPPYMLAL